MYDLKHTVVPRGYYLFVPCMCTALVIGQDKKGHLSEIMAVESSSLQIPVSSDHIGN